MILGKIWKALAAQFNKLGNWFSGYDPIAEMQYEYDRSVDQLREGREGLAQYRALVERVTRQVDGQRKQVAIIEAKINEYDADLKMGRAEAEMSQLATQFNVNVNVTTDFGQAEQMVQDQIDKNRARVRVAADLSGEGVEDVKREIA